MKALGFTFAGSILLSGLAFAAPQKNQAFRGEIMDSACAETGAHDAMMKSHPNMKTAKAGLRLRTPPHARLGLWICQTFPGITSE